MSRPTSSLWLATTNVPRHRALKGEVQADVCVVGGGVAGLSTAYWLARAGKSVVLLEKTAIGHGQTGRTTAHLSNVMDDRFTRLESLHGEEGARMAAASHGAAIDAFERIILEEGIDCDFRRVDGWLFQPPGADPDALEEEAEAARRAGLAPEWAERAPWPAFQTGRCLRFGGQAQLHPLAFLIGLSHALITRYGVRVHARSRVVSVDDLEGGKVVKTATGARVVCEHVVLATNSPSGRYLAQMKTLPYRTYAMAFRVERGRIPVGLYWDTEQPYHYVRLQTMADGEALIVGGEDHSTGSGKRGAHGRLEKWTRARFPEAGEVLYRWSGQVLEPADALGFIGRADDPRVYFCTGDSGQGMTHGMLGALLITDLIQGREHPWAELYSPSRLTLGAAPRYADEVVNAAGRFLKYFLPGEVSGVDEIAAGSGAVIKRGLHPVAVYRDPSGALHERSAVCTHMGCVVAWNPEDPGWDCQCHGSRFDPLGRVVTGPAVADLAEAHPAKARAPERRGWRSRKTDPERTPR